MSAPDVMNQLESLMSKYAVGNIAVKSFAIERDENGRVPIADAINMLTSSSYLSEKITERHGAMSDNDLSLLAAEVRAEIVKSAKRAYTVRTKKAAETRAKYHAPAQSSASPPAQPSAQPSSSQLYLFG